MQVVDAVYNTFQLLFVALCNVVLTVASFLLPFIETLPEASLLAVTELGGLALDILLVLAASAKALFLRLVYLSVFSLDVSFGVALNALVDADAALKGLLGWLVGLDPFGVLLSLLLARPFELPARLLLGGTKLVAQWTMAGVELAASALFATPALFGCLLIPVAYAAYAVFRRARRTVVTEPQLSFGAQELAAKVALLRPLQIPPLPVEEKRAELETLNFVNAAAQLRPLRPPPLPVEALREANAEEGVDSLSRAEAVDALLERTEVQARYSISSSTVVSMPAPSGSFDGLAAVKANMSALGRAVNALPPLMAPGGRGAAGAGAESAATAAALADAQAALAEAEAAFNAVDGGMSATTTTVTSLDVDPSASEAQAALFRGLASGLGTASATELSGTQKRRSKPPSA